MVGVGRRVLVGEAFGDGRRVGIEIIGNAVAVGLGVDVTVKDGVIAVVRFAIGVRMFGVAHEAAVKRPTRQIKPMNSRLLIRKRLYISGQTRV
jgi:hypothetical protein